MGKNMRDYPQWRMFREARTADATDLAWPVVGLVSGFAEGRSVDDAIKAHWRIWHAGRGFYRVVVYGSWGEAEDGYVLFNVEERRRGDHVEDVQAQPPVALDSVPAASARHR